MRLSFAEFGHEYESYSFGYTVHGVLEAHDHLNEVYGKGFLPYSATDADPNLFYMSRSVRVPVGEYEPNSENRRILRKFEGQFTCNYLDADALRASASFRSIMLTYFKERHGAWVMPEERLNKILERSLPLRAAEYSKDSVPIAYVLEVADDSFLHYWYSCYALAYAHTSLGMWLMLDAIRRANDEQHTHVYLGTAYGAKGKYKTNIPNLEYWDGNHWQTNAKQLQALMRSDTTDSSA